MDHAKVVLGGIIPGRRDRLMVAMQQLEEEHFRQDAERVMFVLLDKFHNITADVMGQKHLQDLLKRKDVEVTKQVLYEELYLEVEAMEVSDADFRYAIEALKDVRSRQLTGEAITTSFEILENGAEVEGRDLKGHDEARAYLYQELGRIDRLGLKETAPEGFMRREAAEMMQEYADKKSKPLSAQGIFTGVPAIDSITAGYQPGELILYCGYTGTGKSMFAVQTAWYAAIKQGKNVFLATTETIRPVVRRRILSRHSREPQFGIPGGLNSRDLKNASLTPETEKKMQEVIADFKENPTYGDIFIAQVPRGATLGFLESRLIRQQANWHIDLVIMDYLALLKPDSSYRDSRVAMFSDLLIEAKQIAVTFDQGRGIPLISPWAMQQGAYKEALKVGEYSLASLSDTSEAEKSADQIMSMLKLDNPPNELKMQFLKNRDGETPPPFTLKSDFKTAYFGEIRDAAVDDLLTEDLT